MLFGSNQVYRFRKEKPNAQYFPQIVVAICKSMKRLVATRILALGAVVALVGCGGSGGFDGSPFGGLLYYLSGELFTTNLNGANVNSAGTNLFLGSMSSGKLIAASQSDGDNEIVTLNADGSDLQQLTNNSDNDVRPSISADGSKIAFVSNRDGNNEIYVMNSNGTNVLRLTNNAADDYFPSMSADGSKVIFSSDRDGNDEIYSINSNGTGLTRLTNDASADTTPAWSPDGTTILFCTDRDGNYEIYSANANGSSQTRISNTVINEFHASYNMTGIYIFYYDDTRLRRIDADGSNITDVGPVGASKTTTFVYP